MDDEEREQYVHYIHNWHLNEGTEEVIVTVPMMEKFIMASFRDAFYALLDPEDPTTKPFYHDFFEEEGMVMKVATKRSFNCSTQLSVRRVLGCGHFILCLVYLEYNALERKLGDSWLMAELWRAARDDLLERNLMSPDEQCDYVSVYQWLHDFYAKVFELMPVTEATEYARIPFTLLRVTGPCEPDHDDTSTEFLQNYQEFLVFHLHNMHELGLLRKGKYQQQYYRLIRMVDMPLLQSLPISHHYRVRRFVRYRTNFEALNVTRIQYVAWQETNQDHTMRRIQLAVDKWRMFARSKRNQQALEAGEPPAGEPPADEPPADDSPPAPNQLHQTWHKVSNWPTPKRWHHISDGVSIKLINVEWKLGCSGCPRTLVRLPSRKTGRQRHCKWITLRRLVLVRRMVWRRRRRIQLTAS